MLLIISDCKRLDDPLFFFFQHLSCMLSRTSASIPLLFFRLFVLAFEFSSQWVYRDEKRVFQQRNRCRRQPAEPSEEPETIKELFGNDLFCILWRIPSHGSKLMSDISLFSWLRTWLVIWTASFCLSHFQIILVLTSSFDCSSSSLMSIYIFSSPYIRSN